jgi:hypothetical protein
VTWPILSENVHDHAGDVGIADFDRQSSTSRPPIVADFSCHGPAPLMFRKYLPGSLPFRLKLALRVRAIRHGHHDDVRHAAVQRNQR